LISANVATRKRKREREREKERERAQIKNEVEDNMVVEKHGKREAIREEKLVIRS